MTSFIFTEAKNSAQNRNSLLLIRRYKLFQLGRNGLNLHGRAKYFSTIFFAKSLSTVFCAASAASVNRFLIESHSIAFSSITARILPNLSSLNNVSIQIRTSEVTFQKASFWVAQFAQHETQQLPYDLEFALSLHEVRLPPAQPWITGHGGRVPSLLEQILKMMIITS